MTPSVARRTFIKGGLLAAGGLLLPRPVCAMAAHGFTHSVASGEPASDAMLLWTRYVPVDGGAARLRVELSESADFARPIGGGEGITGPWRDHTIKIMVSGLQPATSYFYRFVAPDGSFSPVGRTRTLPDDLAARFGIAVFSCANMEYGYFHAYGHAARREDVDLVLHLGDYFYEYDTGNAWAREYGMPNRKPLPEHEIVHLADYRQRYASYRRDPDLMALHAAKPMIAQWDDHEFANDTWQGGAAGHDAASEGDWSSRRAAAEQAYREWMPVSDMPWAHYAIGTLATLFRTEGRALGRSRPPELSDFLKASDPRAALAAFRDGAWTDPAMTMLGSQQETWLGEAIRRSVRVGARWQVVGLGTTIGQRAAPADLIEWLSPNANPWAVAGARSAVLAAELGLPMSLDDWGGYPAARARLLTAAQDAEANLIVLSGDSHNAWSFNLRHGDHPVGVEFAGSSVTSIGFEMGIAADPARVARTFVEANPELAWCDTSRRGYMITTLTPDTARNDWWFVENAMHPKSAVSLTHSAHVARESNATSLIS